MKNNKKFLSILLVNTLYYPFSVGGAEVSVQSIAEQLSLMGHKVSIVTLSDKTEIEYGSHNGVDIYRLPLRNVYWPYSKTEKRSVFFKLAWHVIDIYNFTYGSQLNSIFKRISPDVVHTNNIQGFSVYLWFYFKAKGIPIIHTTRDYYLFSPSATNSNISNRVVVRFFYGLLVFFKRFFSEKVDFYIPISKAIMDLHKSFGFFNSTPSLVIPNSVVRVPSGYLQLSKKRKGLRFGYIGRLVEYKGIEVLLNAFIEADTDAELLVAGEGEYGYENKIKEKFSRDNVIFLGHVDSRKFYSEIDILVVPSLWAEPFGRVIPEAYSFGKPVIASDAGGIPELIVNGVTGFIFAAGDAKELAKIIGNVTLNDIGKMNDDVLKYAERFYVESVADEFVKAYRECIATNFSSKGVGS